MLLDCCLQHPVAQGLTYTMRTIMSDDPAENKSRLDPAEQGRLGFSRSALSLVGLVVVLGFLAWFFLFI